ncbi:MAG TPA: pitrilysin family protein, partial [Thermoanaerobaculia bacterium]|nr:pitrilysin family protein [Thermoanaerobaculia bacterium]
LLAALALVAAPLFAKPLQVPVVYYRLPNGLRVIISEDHLAPTVTVAVYYGVGFRVEPKGLTGFAHLFEHMMFQGSANVKKFEHAKIVEANGGQLNGSTRLDFTNFYETLPSDRVETALWLESDRMRSLDVSEENLKNQQNVVSEEVRNNVLNQPYAAFEWLDLWQNANENWFNAHNFYGDLRDLEAAKLDDVRKFFHTYYAPNNAALVVAGDVEAEAVRGMVAKYFSDIPLQSVPERPDISEGRQTKEKRINQTDKLANVPALAFGYHLPRQDSNDYPAMVLLNLILQGDDSSRFFRRMIKEKAICVDWQGGINLGLGNEFDYDGPMLMTSRTTYKPDHKAAEILDEVDAITKDVREHGVSAKELADAKVRFRSNYFDQLETTFGKANLLASFALFEDDPGRINKVIDQYEGVTLDQVQAAARTYMVTSNRTAIDRVPEKGPAKSEKGEK